MTTPHGSRGCRGCRLRSSTSRNRSDIYTALFREFRAAERTHARGGTTWKRPHQEPKHNARPSGAVQPITNRTS